MPLASSSDRGELRSAIEGLLRTCADLDRRSDDAGRESRAQADRVARQLVGLRLPGLRGLADEVAGIGKLMNTDVTRTLAEARRPYVIEIHQLLGVLAPIHGSGPIPPLNPAPSTAGFAAQFPPGFAQTYVKDLLSSVQGSITIAVDDAGRLHVVSQTDADDAKVAAGIGFSDTHRDEGIRMLQDSTSHAVEQHGPQIPDQAHLARLIWQRDPTGTYSWQVLPTGAVETSHRAGSATGGFTSPAALAKPIEAVMAVAHASAGGLNEFLTKNTKKKTKKIGIHVSAELAGLTSGDASGYLGAGTGTRETQRDWLRAREYGITRGRATVYGVPYDPISDGTDPGATIVFKRVGEAWHLVTCYPVDKQSPMNARLEDLR